MRYRPGDRVGALLDMNDKSYVVRLLGYGTYEGEHVPEDTGPRSLTRLLREDGIRNPKIRLDDGSIVWGCECWWGDEDEFRTRIAELIERGWSVENVRIEDFRE